MISENNRKELVRLLYRQADIIEYIADSLDAGTCIVVDDLGALLSTVHIVEGIELLVLSSVVEE